MKKLGFALLAVVVGVGAASAAQVGGDACTLINGMRPVFNTLRTLAFLGAAFCMAGWAWGYIAAGDVKKDDLKDKGVALLVGFTLLFSIGIVLQFLGPLSGCNMNW